MNTLIETDLKWRDDDGLYIFDAGKHKTNNVYERIRRADVAIARFPSGDGYIVKNRYGRADYFLNLDTMERLNEIPS